MKKRISILIFTILIIVPFAKTANQSNQLVLLSSNERNSLLPYYYLFQLTPYSNTSNISINTSNTTNPKIKVLELAAQPYSMYLKKATKQIANSIELQTYSKWGILVLILLMWFCQSLALIKNE